MSHTHRILLTILSVASTCNALPNVHKYMTPHELQSVFHVDKHADVPHYEVIQLLHHSAAGSEPGGVALHYRNRRSINSAWSAPSPSPTTATATVYKETHHVKKDLSKNPYYSELKTATAAAIANSNAANSVHANVEKPKTSRNNIDANDLSQIKEHNVSFSAFGKHHNLTLRATQGLFKGAPHKLRIWTAKSEANATHGLDLEEILEGHNNSDDIGYVFQDEDNMAAILMRRHAETGDMIMEGSIGHEMVIKPLPHSLSPIKDQAHHVIYKREPAQMDHLSDFAFMEPDDLIASQNLERLQQQRRRRRSASLADLAADDAELAEDELEDQDELTTSESRNRARRQAPYMIYPEILVIVDYDGYRLHGGDNLQVKRYFISFWNGVDLRYRLLKGPRIRISIAGIIISRGRDATPYLERNRVGRDAIDSAAALTDMGKYLFRERRLPVYDIAVAITKLDMCRRTSQYGECNRGTAGFAYVGGACVVNKRLEKVNSVAIIEDTGGFSGIIVAAHEVGHLLGAVHDGSPPPSYLGGPGAQRCRWEDGYIMSDLRHTERGFRWSPCTVQSFHHFLNGDTATCLHNQPHEDGALGRSLPGTLLSLDAQCRRDRGTYACFKDERVCAQLFCFDAQTGYCVAYRPAAEGSSCGNGLHCLDGRCTPTPTNNIGIGPQYSLVYNATNSSKKKSIINNGHSDISDNNNQNNNNNSENIDDENDEFTNSNGNGSGNGDNVESNEAIDKQKRKFDVKFTTRLQQEQQLQQQQLQQQQQQQEQKMNNVQKSISTTTDTSVQQPLSARNSIFGGRSPTTARSNSFLETYFRKLQAFNAPAQQSSTANSSSSSSSSSSSAQVSPTTSTSTTAPTTTTTTASLRSSSSSSSSSKGSNSAMDTNNNSNNKKQQQTQFDKFAGQILKLVNWKAFPF